MAAEAAEAAARATTELDATRARAAELGRQLDETTLQAETTKVELTRVEGELAEQQEAAEALQRQISTMEVRSPSSYASSDYPKR
eukprot:3561497-Pyramimonas_sp.AAC.1